MGLNGSVSDENGAGDDRLVGLVAIEGTDLAHLALRVLALEGLGSALDGPDEALDLVRFAARPIGVDGGSAAWSQTHGRARRAPWGIDTYSTST